MSAQKPEPTPELPDQVAMPGMGLAELVYAAELARIHAVQAIGTAPPVAPRPGTSPQLRDLSPLGR